MVSPSLPVIPTLSAKHPFETLTPDQVLDALEGVGLRGDGRLTALSSYENRVYQVQLEDGSSVVTKFYRPGRWSEQQIQEEHDFSRELEQAEVPAVGPLELAGATLHHFGGFMFSVSPRRQSGCKLSANCNGRLAAIAGTSWRDFRWTMRRCFISRRLGTSPVLKTSLR